ncbi:unnamed protein product [Polarella glacialis]|uniref:N-acetyltransferase domain-containing protein n=1 Tax=Polarella glacialis TaxID=89957 RepID=A0A813DU08_POLGL|nr:unnamed protein product [Polarella glacialis]
MAPPPVVAVPAEIPEDFVLGLVVAPTGGGKTLALAALRAQRGLGGSSISGADLEFCPRTAVLAHPGFASPEEAVGRLSAAGLGAVPTWCRPFWALSHGEQHRVTCALSLADGALLDDFGVFTASSQARGSAAALARFVRSRGLRRVVIAVAEEELADWLSPDWIWWPGLQDGEPRVLIRAEAGKAAQLRPEVTFRMVEGLPKLAALVEDSCLSSASKSVVCDRTSVRCEVSPHPSMDLVRSRFDYSAAQVQVLQLPAVPARLLRADAVFAVGLLLGPSGTGKTTGLRAFQETLRSSCEATVPERSPTASREDQSNRAKLLQWLGLREGLAERPVETLSSGERHICTVAEALLQAAAGTAVVDELGSTLDSKARARLCRGLRRALSGEDRIPGLASRLVAATLHGDVAKWLLADWVLDTASGLLWERSDEGVSKSMDNNFDVDDPVTDEVVGVSCGFRHPTVPLEVQALSSVDRSRAWRRFERHHYLSSELSPASECFQVSWGSEPVAFAAVLPREGRNGSSDVREHRLVVLPDFQGLGIGMGLSEFLAEHALSTGFFGCKPPQQYFSSTAHAHLGAARARSSRWGPTPFDGSRAARPGDRRVLFKHVYLGKGGTLASQEPHQAESSLGDLSAPKLPTALEEQQPPRSSQRDRRRRAAGGDAVAGPTVQVGDEASASSPAELEVQVLLLSSSRPWFWATSSPGLEDVVAEEVLRKLPGAEVQVAKGSGRVAFQHPTLQKPKDGEDQELQKSLAALLSPERLYVQVASAVGLKPGKPGLLALQGLATTQPGLAEALAFAAEVCIGHNAASAAQEPITFRVTCRRSGSRVLGSDEAAAALAAGVSECLGWEPNLQSYNLEILLWMQGERLLLGTSLGGQWQRGSAGQSAILAEGRKSVLSELRPSLAYSMLARCLGEEPGRAEILVDPMCGSNVTAEVATGSEFAASLFCVSGDLVDSAIAAAQWNLSQLAPNRRARIDLVRWDSRRLPLRQFCADRILVQPPSGRFFGAGAQALDRLYRATLAECRRVLRPRGREQRGGAASKLVLLAADRSPALAASADMVAGAEQGCEVASGKDLGLAWVRLGETRLAYEGGDTTLLLLGTRVRPLKNNEQPNRRAVVAARHKSEGGHKNDNDNNNNNHSLSEVEKDEGDSPGREKSRSPTMPLAQRRQQPDLTKESHLPEGQSAG